MIYRPNNITTALLNVKTGLRAPWLVDPNFAPRTLATLCRGQPKEKDGLFEKSNSNALGKRPDLCETLVIGHWSRKNLCNIFSSLNTIDSIRL